MTEKFAPPTPERGDFECWILDVVCKKIPRQSRLKYPLTHAHVRVHIQSGQQHAATIKSKIQNPKFKIQNPKFKIGNL